MCFCRSVNLQLALLWSLVAAGPFLQQTSMDLTGTMCFTSPFILLWTRPLQYTLGLSPSNVVPPTWLCTSSSDRGQPHSKHTNKSLSEDNTKESALQVGASASWANAWFDSIQTQEDHRLAY